MALVERRIGTVLERLDAKDLVVSAAAGADLLALDEAARRGIRTHVVLPFERERFERASVADRSGPWQKLYAAALARAHIEILPERFEDDDDAYAAVTEALLACARALDPCAAAVVVWDGSRRDANDHTARFLQRARKLEMLIVEVSTLP